MLRILVCALLLAACGDDDRLPSDSGVPRDGTTTMNDGAAPDTPRPDAGPLSPLVDPSCLDGQYTEALPNVSAPIDDVPFENVSQFTDAVLDRRYPVGAALVRGGRTNPRRPTPCDVEFANIFGAPSRENTFRAMGFIVHECGHIYDSALSDFGSNTFYITPDLSLTCSRGDTTSRGGDTFARSRILGDEYAALRPPGDGSSQDSYADIYLDGNPDDGTFESGDQGFNLLFEEYVQYVNSLAEGWAFIDQAPPGQITSARDGILTFSWYLTRYLRMARTQFPDAYSRITDDCWRPAILQLWGRAWLYIEATNGMERLGINDDAIYELATNPELLQEIQFLRDMQGC